MGFKDILDKSEDKAKEALGKGKDKINEYTEKIAGDRADQRHSE